MSFEAIAGVAQAEAEAKELIFGAELKARQMSAEADSELAELRKQADAKAMTEAGELSTETENRKAALRARAEARLEKAAALVVERIVNS